MKPRKISDYRGEKTWLYRGHRITTKARREGSYPRKVISWTDCTINGSRHQGISGMKAAVKFIDSLTETS